MIKHWVFHTLEVVTWNREGFPPRVEAALKKMAEEVSKSSKYVFKENELAKIAEELACATKLREINLLLWTAATSSGFKHASLVSLSGCAMQGEFNGCTSYSREWMMAKTNQRAFSEDPIIKELLEGREEFSFAELRKSPRSNDTYWFERENFRLGQNGFALRVNSSKLSKSVGIIFCSENSEKKTDSLICEHGSDLKEVAKSAAEAFVRISSFKNRGRTKLSAVELRFLRTLALSDDPKEVEKIRPAFGSRRSLEASIREKLGVNTILQAIVVAVENEMFAAEIFESNNTQVLFHPLEGWNFIENPEPCDAYLDEAIKKGVDCF